MGYMRLRNMLRLCARLQIGECQGEAEFCWLQVVEATSGLEQKRRTSMENGKHWKVGQASFVA